MFSCSENLYRLFSDVEPDPFCKYLTEPDPSKVQLPTPLSNILQPIISTKPSPLKSANWVNTASRSFILVSKAISVNAHSPLANGSDKNTMRPTIDSLSIGRASMTKSSLPSAFKSTT